MNSSWIHMRRENQSKPLSLRSKRETGKYRATDSLKQRWTTRTNPRVKNLNCNWWIAGYSEWTTLRDKTFMGRGHTIIIQALDQGTTVNIREKFPWTSYRGRGKRTILPFWNIPKHSVLFNNVSLHRKLINQSLTYWSIKAWTWGKKKYPFLAYCIHFVPHKRGEKSEKYL